MASLERIPNGLDGLPPAEQLKAIQNTERVIQQQIWELEKKPGNEEKVAKLQERLAVLNDKQNKAEESLEKTIH